MIISFQGNGENVARAEKVHPADEERISTAKMIVSCSNA